MKVLSFLGLIALLWRFESSIVVATTAVLLSELLSALVTRYLGWRLGLKNFRIEGAMLLMLAMASSLGLFLIYHFEPVAVLHPLWQLVVLGVLVSAMFAPLLMKLLYPLVKRR